MKPMLAATVESYDQLTFPLLASPKLDGIRVMVVDGVLVSRNLKPIRNKYTQELWPLKLMEGFDGELIVGDPTSPTCFRDTSSGVMSVGGEPKVEFWAFDKYDCEKFDYRYKLLQQNVKNVNRATVRVVTQTLIKDAFALHEYEQRMIDRGYEGVMLRHPRGLYKQGRSTLKEGHLMKLKKFADSEAEILEVIELDHNMNEKTTDALGRSKRSSHKAGKVKGGVMGALRVRDIHTGVEFQIGAGFTDADRDAYWRQRKGAVGTIIKYKYFPTGSKDKPRFPVFLGIRDKADL